MCDISSLRVKGPSEPGRLRDVCVCQWVNLVFVLDMVILYFLAIRFRWYAIVCRSSSDVPCFKGLKSPITCAQTPVIVAYPKRFSQFQNFLRYFCYVHCRNYFG